MNAYTIFSDGNLSEGVRVDLHDGKRVVKLDSWGYVPIDRKAPQIVVGSGLGSHIQDCSVREIQTKNGVFYTLDQRQPGSTSVVILVDSAVRVWFDVREILSRIGGLIFLVELVDKAVFVSGGRVYQVVDGEVKRISVECSFASRTVILSELSSTKQSEVLQSSTDGRMSAMLVRQGTLVPLPEGVTIPTEVIEESLKTGGHIVVRQGAGLYALIGGELEPLTVVGEHRFYVVPEGTNFRTKPNGKGTKLTA